MLNSPRDTLVTGHRKTGHEERSSLEVASRSGNEPTLSALDAIQHRILWLSTRIIDYANRRNKTEIKVGGHQASSASMVTIMTALWFGHLRRGDKVAVKPHASPVYHAIQYLIGRLDRTYLTTLRQAGGLQAYPSRTKDPDVADYSTGSVGLGAVAPLFSALTLKYLATHFTESDDTRFISLIGDAELDEGNIWEAVLDPATSGLGNFTLVVDVNRQSLDRVVPNVRAQRLERMFEAAGWNVVEAKYGSRLESLFQAQHGHALRTHLDQMPNEEYQHLLRLPADRIREALLNTASSEVSHAINDVPDESLGELVGDLGGHDLAVLRSCLEACDSQREAPSVLFAYTIKGWGLPIAGDPLNHAALLDPEQIDELRRSVGLTSEEEWDRFDPRTPEGRLCEQVGQELSDHRHPPKPRIIIPENVRPATQKGQISTQEAFGRVLASLADNSDVGPCIVTSSPDVSISTNLGGWINKVGVFAPHETADYGGSDRLLKWSPGPTGQHIELGISEMNLFLLLGQLGLAREHFNLPLLPIGTVYDPFVLRGLDALIYSLYSDSRFIVVGTPSGVTLSPEGGAHQSTITPSVGLEIPGLDALEPTYAAEVDWLLCDALRRLDDPAGRSSYLRLSTRPVDQGPFLAALARYGEQRLQRSVLAGGYTLLEPEQDHSQSVVIATTGAATVEAVRAAAELMDEGVTARVVQITSADRLFSGWQNRVGLVPPNGRITRTPCHLFRLFRERDRSVPLVSVHDAASHSLSWLGSALGLVQTSLGVDRFGESGEIDEVYKSVGISAGDIVNACLIAVYE